MQGWRPRSNRTPDIEEDGTYLNPARVNVHRPGQDVAVEVAAGRVPKDAKTYMPESASLLIKGAAYALLVGIVCPSHPRLAARAQPVDPATTSVRIKTDLGAIEVELYPDKAPVTVANFLRYVDAGHYEGGSFFRTVTMDNQPNNDVKIEVVQAGVHPWQDNFSFEPIEIETTDQTGIRHVDGAISMARGAPNSATSSFFICIGDQPELDFGGRRNPDGQGFAAFGKVIDGMDVVRAIQRSPAKGQALIPTITIESVAHR